AALAGVDIERFAGLRQETHRVAEAQIDGLCPGGDRRKGKDRGERERASGSRAREHAVLLARSTGQDTAVQTPDGIEGGQDRAFLPTSPIGRVLAGKQDASIDRAEIAVVLLPRLVGPGAFAAKRR